MGCGDIDPCTPYICQRPGTPSDEGYARIMLRGATTPETAVDDDGDDDLSEDDGDDD